MRRAGDVWGRRGGQRPLKQQLSGGLKLALLVLLICSLYLFTTIRELFSSTIGIGSVSQSEVFLSVVILYGRRKYYEAGPKLFTSVHTGAKQVAVFVTDVDKLWGTAASGGWRPSSAPRSSWPSPPNESNGYLRVRCNGGLNQQRSADFEKLIWQLAMYHHDKNEWWMNFGIDDLELQNLAIRILSQTCSSSGCERNLSVFELIHTKRRNRLEHKRLNDLVYTHYNLRLKERSSGGSRFRPIPRLLLSTCGFIYIRLICNAVLAARIMNATLVLPELDTNSFWRDESGFPGIYDVDHFIRSLRYDVRVVEHLPEIQTVKGKKKMKAIQLKPPRDAPPSWYTTVALEKMREHGAIYLTPFSHRLAEEIDNPEYQRLRCRVNYHALRFKPHIMRLSSSIVSRLRAQGHFMAIHLRFELDMLAFAGCIDIFSPREQIILTKYRKENFAEKELVYSERRAIGKCPLTPEEVGLILHSMGFNNSTRIYLAAGELFGGERFMKPLRGLFPHLENHSSVIPAEDLVENTRGLVGAAVDYMVCLLSDIFMPTYDGPSNFANNLMGHRLYYGFRTTIQPNRKALAPIFIDREKGHVDGFEAAIRRVMLNTPFGGPHKRVQPESFYTNSWPECFCQADPENLADKCPPENVVEVLNSQLQNEEGGYDTLGTTKSSQS